MASSVLISKQLLRNSIKSTNILKNSRTSTRGNILITANNSKSYHNRSNSALITTNQKVRLVHSFMLE